MKQIKIEGDPNLARDPNTNAVVNTNNNAYMNYMKKRNKKKEENAEIENLKNEIDEIKSLLKTLINKS
jgi:hypothetical protein